MLIHVLALSADPEFAADVAEAPQPDDPRDGPGGFLDPAVDDERVELVGERAGLAVFAVMCHFPLDRCFAMLVHHADVDDDVAVLRQPVHRIAGEGGFHPDRVGREDLGARLRRRIHVHSFGRKSTTNVSCWCCSS